MSGSVREYIADQIRPNIPDGWKLEPGIPTLGTLAAPVLWIEYTGFEPAEEAPLAKINVSADLCIATHKTDITKGEGDADEHVAALYEAVFAAHTFYRISARKAVFNDAYVGWRLSINVITTNPTTEE
ncbi:hypothetical protein [Microbacterium sp. XT11]|uniref:hypothetical protein n=1 Tax=Microbacterium sp. XT11 TaxID=367477 RepID=UPI00082F86A4|nr:hypothetical protein [Microbacterium sp. XT11]